MSAIGMRKFSLRSFLKNFGQVLLAFCVIGGAVLLLNVVAIIVQEVPFDRYFAKDSRLKFAELRITHIPGEFERRSALFAASWKTFKICSQIDACDSAGALAMRDQAIRLDWPKVFDRLMVARDWGEAMESDIAHKDFLRAVEREGEERLRNNCFPIIAFLTVTMKGPPLYLLQGFSCDGAPAY